MLSQRIARPRRAGNKMIEVGMAAIMIGALLSLRMVCMSMKVLIAPIHSPLDIVMPGYERIAPE